MKTTIDTQKAQADILITAYYNDGATIFTRGIELKGKGVKETYSNNSFFISETLLAELKKQYNVMTDF
jgi:hypothetical protein